MATSRKSQSQVAIETAELAVEGANHAAAEGNQDVTTGQAVTSVATMKGPDGHDYRMTPFDTDPAKNAAAIRADQDGIFRDSSDIIVRINQNAIQSMIHAQMHGDLSLIQRLIDGLGSGYRLDGIKRWLLTSKFPVRVEPNTIDTEHPVGRLKMKEDWAKPENWKALEAPELTPAQAMQGVKTEAERAKAEENANKVKPKLTVKVVEGWIFGLGSQVMNAVPGEKQKGRFEGFDDCNPEDLKLAILQAHRAFKATLANPSAVREMYAAEARREKEEMQAKVDAAKETARSLGIVLEDKPVDTETPAEEGQGDEAPPAGELAELQQENMVDEQAA